MALIRGGRSGEMGSVLLLMDSCSSNVLLFPESLGLSSVQPQNVDLYFPTPIAEGDDLTMKLPRHSTHLICLPSQQQFFLLVTIVIVTTEIKIRNMSFPPKTYRYPPMRCVVPYKGNREIFRYTQKESPPKKSFPLSHVIVDVSFLRVYFPDIQFAPISTKASLGFVTTECGTHVPLALRGVISCEVSFEPSFQTIIKTSQLLVVSKPKTRPSLTVEFYPLNKPNSKTGVETVMVKKDDVLTANCTAGPSIPSPNITFFINGENYVRLFPCPWFLPGPEILLSTIKSCLLNFLLLFARIP
ncbi:hypothetical protein Fcan01_22516 [Folsomia candida]|uniref:Ig-like domain-containing protein n=1 Tax=Folsomia candida TaxID=158441 RepID=A0A226DB66_FOLCA|nr:hypothetical protein Fcan01_22516 [Folsomia candida]